MGPVTQAGDPRGDLGLFLTGHAMCCLVSHGAAEASRVTARHGVRSLAVPREVWMSTHTRTGR